MFHEFIYEFGCTKVPDEEKDSNLNLNLNVGKACKSTGAKGDEGLGSRCRGRFGECRRRLGVERVIDDGKNDHDATKTVLQNLT